MAYSREIVEEAKRLYLELDELGNRKYGLKTIAKIINEKFNLKVNHTTILKWRDKENWDELLRQKLILMADKELRKSVEERPEDITQEEKIKELITKAKNQPLIALIRLSKKLETAVKSMSPEDKRFPRLAEVATKTFHTLHTTFREMESPEEVNKERPIIIINEINPEEVDK